MQRKLQYITKNFDNVRFCVRLLCELHPSLLQMQMIYVTTHAWNSDTDMAISLLHFTSLFSKGRITASKEVKTVITRGMWRVSVMPLGRLSVLSRPVAGRVISHTCSLSHWLVIVIVSYISLFSKSARK